MIFLTVHVITGKPNSRHDTEEGEEDSEYTSFFFSYIL